MNIKNFCKSYCNCITSMKETKNGLFIYGNKGKYGKVYTYISKQDYENIDFIKSMLDTFMDENERLGA